MEEIVLNSDVLEVVDEDDDDAGFSGDDDISLSRWLELIVAWDGFPVDVDGFPELSVYLAGK